jgi:hypothetical protein
MENRKNETSRRTYEEKNVVLPVPRSYIISFYNCGRMSTGTQGIMDTGTCAPKHPLQFMLKRNEGSYQSDFICNMVHEWIVLCWISGCNSSMPACP